MNLWDNKRISADKQGRRGRRNSFVLRFIAFWIPILLDQFFTKYKVPGRVGVIVAPLGHQRPLPDLGVLEAEAADLPGVRGQYFANKSISDLGGILSQFLAKH